MKGFVDSNMILSDAQAVTATASSTNEIKFPNTTVGEGSPYYVHIGVDTAFSATAGTIAIKLQDSADGTTYADMQIAAAAVNASTLSSANAELWRWPLPSDTRQYIKVLYTVTGSPSDGTFDAYVSDH